jgi:multicomponent Na+:H+ antiporter subunit G
MATFIIIISVVLILAGLFFFLGAAVGLLRFPDFYARMHAAGKGDTLSSLLVILGLAVYQLHDFDNFAEDWLTLLVILKLLAVVLFIFLTSPTATSSLMDAGWEDNVKPIISEGRSNHLEEDCGKNA